MMWKEDKDFLRLGSIQRLVVTRTLTLPENYKTEQKIIITEIHK